MSHHRPLVAGLLAVFAALVLAPAVAVAALPSKAARGAQAKERAYGKHCGSKRKGPARAAQRAKCLDAMARLATGRASSPRAACRSLTRRKARGERRSAYARCVSEGARLLKARRRAEAREQAAADAPRGAGEGSDAGDPADGGEAVDDPASIPPHELLPEDFLGADQLDPDF